MNSNMTELPLRGIHLSEPISWWPLAYGWWIVIVFAIFLLGLFFYSLKKYLKPTLKKEAINALNQIEKSFLSTDDSLSCISDLSAFLRRVTIQIDQPHCAGITGRAWLEHLDKRLKEPEFSQGVGQILIYAPYQPSINTDETSELIKLCKKWVNNL